MRGESASDSARSVRVYFLLPGHLSGQMPTSAFAKLQPRKRDKLIAFSDKGRSQPDTRGRVTLRQAPPHRTRSVTVRICAANCAVSIANSAAIG